MRPYHPTGIACLGVLLLAGCERSAPPPAAAVGAARGPANGTVPFCSIVAHQKHELAAGTELNLWHLWAHGLKELRAQLWIISEGKVETIGDTHYKWDRWDNHQPTATGQIILLMQDGQAFGVKGKRRPQLVLEIQDSPGHAKTGQQVAFTLDGDLQPRTTNAGFSTPLANKAILFSELYMSGHDMLPATLSSDLDGLIEVSKKGRTVMAVNLEWQPQ
jgi:hypothetical protein